MRWTVAVALLAAPLPLAAQQGLALERITSSPSLIGTAPSTLTWSPDSRSLAFLWNDQALPTRSIWLVDAGDSVPRRLAPAPGDTSARGGVAELAWLPDGTALLYLQAGDVWRTSRTGGPPTRLTRDGGDKSTLAVAPDGRHASFLRDGDLWLLSLPGGTPVRATRVGVPPVGSVPGGRYYRPDAEIGPYVWGGPSYAWSPDSRFIAVHYADRRHVRTVPFPYYLGEETRINQLRRAYPGDSNEIRRVGFYQVAGGTLTFLDLPDPHSIRVADFSWSVRGELLIDRESDDAIHRWLHVASPTSGELRQVWHDQRPSRVYTGIASAWLTGGTDIAMVSDLEEYYRLYVITPGDSAPRPITSASADVLGGPLITGGGIFFFSNAASPYQRHLYRAGLGTALTTRPGNYSGTVSPDGRVAALLYTDDVTPTDLYLMATQPGARDRRVTTSPPAEFTRQQWVAARYVTFKSRIDDYTLHARIMEPPHRTPGRRYPVIIGPAYSNTVRNRWAGPSGTLQQYLVQRGYIVVQVDVRGSTGYGRRFREEFLMDWGGEDLEDLHSTVEYLGTLPHVDTSRVGIWGSSYGGLLTVFALFRKPGLFRAGVAGAPATDPRFFGPDDVAIARRPQTHPDAFARGTAMQYAPALRDHLLIIHGMMDDVVPFKTSVDLAEHLMRLGKDFDFAFAPAATHGWSGRDYYATYLYRKLVDHFDRYLGKP